VNRRQDHDRDATAFELHFIAECARQNIEKIKIQDQENSRLSRRILPTNHQFQSPAGLRSYDGNGKNNLLLISSASSPQQDELQIEASESRG
jgi:hypothetical protein